MLTGSQFRGPEYCPVCHLSTNKVYILELLTCEFVRVKAVMTENCCKLANQAWKIIKQLSGDILVMSVTSHFRLYAYKLYVYIEGKGML